MPHASFHSFDCAMLKPAFRRASEKVDKKLTADGLRQVLEINPVLVFLDSGGW